MFRLLHLHFESVLRTLAVAAPASLAQVHATFHSREYREASPPQRLQLLEKQIQHFARLHANLFTRQIFTRIVQAFLKELDQSDIEHVDLRIGVSTQKWTWMETIADGMQVFEHEQKMHFPAISLSFLGALNFAKSVTEIDEIFDLMLNNPFVRNAFIGYDINLVPADFPKFVRYVPLLLAAQQQGKKINIHLGELFNNAFSQNVLSFLIPHRIGHGVKLLEDQGLVNFLKSHNICLDLCPTSNQRLGVCDWTHPHNPARRAMQLGIPVSLNTDDPVLFQSTLAQEIALANLTPEEIAQVLATGRTYGYKR